MSLISMDLQKFVKIHLFILNEQELNSDVTEGP